MSTANPDRRPDLPTRGCAAFFDFDGTLVDLAPTPEEIVVAPGLPQLLADLRHQLVGAVAVVSGRPVTAIDAYLSPQRFCSAGVHGAEWRGPDEEIHRMPAPRLDAVYEPLEALRMRFPALRVERKPGAIALHYRQAPELEAVCLDAMHAALERVEGMVLLGGKFVIELKPQGASKAAAVRRFMEQAPFKYRRPWFFGDDVTDEGAFEAVRVAGGVTIKVGPGETIADYRLDAASDVLRWIDHAIRHLEAASSEGAP
ncbi:MAG TPA: trehalose-phosphatase [Aromatoleum sp.]|uniref:trehalose-phosphatase n=1 Tax=Aromatoleum sp. TaxID=2307007 RepID=UPI002B4720BD|nr:trehalose-phosphatase [Aromatoleum sp.]HJV27922.1 trehalose-phosphatase [Aromatoleum sp.]